MGREDPFSQAKGRKGGRKEERMSVERGIWVGRSWGGGGNRKETEARDMRSKAKAWWSLTPKPGRDWESVSPAILVAWGL